MKRVMRLVILLSLLLSTVTYAADASLCATRANDILQALQRGDAAAARAHFDTRMRSALDAAALTKIWQQKLPEAFGPYQRAGAAQMTHPGALDVALVPLQFGNGPMTMRVACSSDGAVSGLFFAPGTPPSIVPPSVDIQGLPGVRERAVSVPTPMGALPGTLMLPAGAGPFPAVLLIVGSGTVNRDETIGPNKPFLDIARGLATAGIASLRYDKRTVIYGAQRVGKPMTIDDEVTDDALSALRVLSQQPGIDAQKIFLLGHSLGAMMAPRIGQRDPQLTGLILLAAPARPMLDVMAQQAQEQGQRAGDSPATIAASEAGIRTEQKRLAGADPHSRPSGTFRGAPESYWLSLRDYRQVDVARQLAMPLLILQGQGDFQVSAVNDFAQWQRGLRGQSNVTFHLYPGLSHLFMPVGRTGTPADYQTPAKVDPRVIGDIVAWVHANASR